MLKYPLMQEYHYSYLIYDLWWEGAYLVSVNISACFEAQGSCLLIETIMSAVKLPKATCGFKTDDFKIAGKCCHFCSLCFICCLIISILDKPIRLISKDRIFSLVFAKWHYEFLHFRRTKRHRLI